MPLHTWLPDAHVEAPTAGSVILAGVLLKMGTYGFIKLGFPLFPDAARAAVDWVMLAAVVSIIYGACLALVQTDIKKIIAYSSISHLGYVMLGLASLDLIGIQGAIIQMVSHGLTAAGLFLMVGMIYERCHSRELAAYGGLAKTLPVYSVFFMILTLAAIGLPTTSGFTGEFLVLLGAFNASWPLYLAGDSVPLVLSVTAVGGVVLGAIYMLWFAQRFLFGATRAPHLPLVDLNGRERAILVALVVAVFWLGLFPQEPLRKTEVAARQYQQWVDVAARPAVTTPRVGRNATGGRTMNWSLMVIALLPEHLLLAGIVVLIGMEVLGIGARGATAVAMGFTLMATLFAAAAGGRAVRGEPVSRTLLGRPSGRWLAKAIVLALALPLLQLSRNEFGSDARFYILLLSSLYGVLLVTSPTVS